MKDYSLEEKVIAGKLKSSASDITIFTEDKDTCNLFYRTIFDRIGLQIGLKIKTQQLGSCDEVENCCISDVDDSFAKLFIVDGDIFLLFNPKKESEKLFPLKRYCIENFLMDSRSISALASLNSGVLEERQIEEKFDFDSEMKILAEKILPIYYRYAVLCSTKDCYNNSGIGRFYDKKFYDEEIQKEIDTVEKEVEDYIRCSDVKKRMISRIETRFPCCKENALIFLSGKDCILPYVLKRIKEKTDINIGMNRNAIKKYLAEKCDIGVFQELTKKISEVVDLFNKRHKHV